MLKKRKRLKCAKCNSKGKKSFMIPIIEKFNNGNNVIVGFKCISCKFTIIGRKN